MKPLTGHTDQNNAYTVENYPYGFKKTSKRFWVESKNKHGQRLCGQTLNPKTNNWNNVKKGVYHQIIILGIDPVNNHVIFEALNYNDDIEKIIEFEKKYSSIFTDFQIEAIKRIKALNKAWEHITVTVGKNTCNPQTRKEQTHIVNKCFNYEYSKLK